jgi:hypothetical protein
MICEADVSIFEPRVSDPFRQPELKVLLLENEVKISVILHMRWADMMSDDLLRVKGWVKTFMRSSVRSLDFGAASVDQLCLRVISIVDRVQNGKDLHTYP